MTTYRGPYYSAKGCDSRSRSGTTALVSWYLGAYSSRGAANLGTYACKRLGSGWSIHAERRAADLGTAPYGGVDSDWGWRLANALRLNSAELGVQLIILGRKVWSCSYPDAGWRNYTGDYHGHMHVELTPDASRNLTATRIQSVIGGTGGGGGGVPTPAPVTDWRKEIPGKMKVLDLSKVTSKGTTHVKGEDVERLQGLLLAAGYGPAGLVGRNGRPDGIGGPGTRKHLGAFQVKTKTGKAGSPATADYVAGKGTWSKLLGV